MESYAKALYDFTASQEWELSVCAGEVVKILSQVDENWYDVETNAGRGQVPITFLEAVPPEQKTLQYVTAVDDFTGADSEQLSFRHGDRIRVIEDLDENWKRGELNGIVGLFPVSYVVESNCVSNGEQLGEVPYAVALYDYTANSCDEISFTSGAIIYLTKDLDADWLEGTYNGVTGNIPKNHLSIVIPLQESHHTKNVVQTDSFKPARTSVALYTFEAQHDYELSFQQGDVITILQQVDENWIEGEVNGRVGLFPAQYVNLDQNSDSNEHKYYDPEETPNSYYNVDDQSNSNVADNMKLEVGYTARALYDYSSENPEDLEFKEGDTVIIKESVDTEWVKAKSEKGIIGFCPRSYLEPFLYDNCFQCDDYDDVEENNALNAKTEGDTNEPDDDSMYENIYESIEDAVTGMHQILSGDTGGNIPIQDTPCQNANEFSHSQGNGSSKQYKESTQNGNNISQVSSTKPVLKPKPELKPKPCLKPKPQLSAQMSSPLPNSSVIQTNNGAGNLGTNNQRQALPQSSKPRTAGVPTSYKRTEAPKSNVDLDAFTALNLDLIAPQTTAPAKRGTDTYNPIYAKPFKPTTSGFRSVKFQIPPSSASTPRTSSNMPPVKEQTKPSYSWETFDQSPTKPAPDTLSFSATIMPASSSMHTSQASPTMPLKPSFPLTPTSYSASMSKRKAPVVPVPAQESQPPIVSRMGNKTLLDSSFDEAGILPEPCIPVPQRTVNASDVKAVEDDLLFWEGDLMGGSKPSNPPQQESGGTSNQVILRSPGSVVRFAGSEDNVVKDNALRGSATPPKGSPKLEHARPRPKPRRPVSFQGGDDLMISRDIKLATNAPGSKPASKVSRSDPRRQTVSFSTKYSPQRPLLQTTSSDDTASGTDNPAFDITAAGSNSKDPDSTEIPGIIDVENHITETKKKLELEIKVVKGMETVLKVVVSDPVKKREMQHKVEDSYEKIQQLNEELNVLEDEKSFLLNTYDNMDQIKEKMKYLEAEIEKQKEVRQSLDLLLRANTEDAEIRGQLALVDQDIEEMKEEVSNLKGTIRRLLGRPKLTPAQRMAEQRQNVITEIIKTEQDYINDLELCINFFLEPLKEWKVPNLDWETLFGNIYDVMELARRFGAQLETASECSDKNNEALGQCFLDFSTEMKEMYASYCRNHDEAIALLEKYEDSAEIQAALAKCLELIRKYTSCWDLSSMLIKPVQRILKYPLLLNELLKSTSPNHPDRPQLFKATNEMTEVANAINEMKRRKDLVLKYQRAEEAGLTNKIQKLNWRSVMKKSSRLNQRITQMTGLVSQTVDDSFLVEERKFKNMEKTMKNFIKNVQGFIDQLQDWATYHIICAENIKDYYMDKTDSFEVESYLTGQQRIAQVLAKELVDELDAKVLSPLNSLLALYQGPHRVIQKRHDKCLDYDSRVNKIEKIKDKDKLKVAKDDLEFARKTYEALNAQLLVDLPLLFSRSLMLFHQCLCNFASAQGKFHKKASVELQPLVNLAIIDDSSTCPDIVEEHSKKMQGITDELALLDFVPDKFGSKDVQKKRASMLAPMLPSAGPVDSDDPQSDQDSFRSSPQTSKRLSRSPTRSKSLKKRQAPAPPPVRTPSPTKPAPPILRQPNKLKQQQSSRKENEVLPAPKKDKKPLPSKQISEEALQYCVEFEFEGQDPAELSVLQGAIVGVLRQCDTSGNSEWWLIEHSGMSGYIPASFLSPVDQQPVKDDEDDVITPEAPPPLYYYAEFPFEASSPVELGLTEGRVVIVVQQHDIEGNPEWWLVEADGQRGYVPSSFLAPVD